MSQGRGGSTILVLLLTLSTLNLGYMLFYWSRRPLLESEIYYSFRGHDYPEYLPISDLEYVHMTDEESIHYKADGYVSDPEWFSMADLAAGSGYICLGPDDRIFAVSMFHQMHCLRMINLAFTKAPIATPAHLQHCLNYLRQGALCSADTSLESGDFEMRNFTWERTGATHTCRDWTQVYLNMEQNFVSWESKTGRGHDENEDSLSPI